MGNEALRTFIAGIERRDRIAYGALAGALIVLVVLPVVATSIATLLLPKTTGAELRPVHDPSLPPPVEPEKKPELTAVESAALAINDRDRAIQSFASGMFVLIVALLATWEVGKRAWARLVAPRRRPRDEIPFVFNVALLPGSVLAIAALFVVERLGDVGKTAGEHLMVPLPLAIAATCYALSFSLILFVRLTRPSSDEQV